MYIFNQLPEDIRLEFVYYHGRTCLRLGLLRRLYFDQYIELSIGGSSEPLHGETYHFVQV